MFTGNLHKSAANRDTDWAVRWKILMIWFSFLFSGYLFQLQIKCIILVMLKYFAVILVTTQLVDKVI